MSAQGWLRIETAPMDGTEFLAFGSYVYTGDEHPTIYHAIISYSGNPKWPWRDDAGQQMYVEGGFSHWMPLPSPPEQREQQP